MAIKLHRCSSQWAKIGGHPCWKVQKALDEQGVAYEVVHGPLRRGKRDDLERLSGQRKYPVIEFEDGGVYRAESEARAERTRAGQLFEQRGSARAGRARRGGSPPVGPGDSPNERARPRLHSRPL